MTRRKNDIPHKRTWKAVYGVYPKKGYHLHHKDGNPSNNSIDNLVEVTPKQHFDIHFSQGDWAACILLARSAEISPDQLAEIQRNHGLKCVERQVGIHSNSFDRSSNAKRIWKTTPPGRLPVTDGERVLKFKTAEETNNFLQSHTNWRRGVPDHHRVGLKQSKRRIDSAEAIQISTRRLQQGTHNFTTIMTCDVCGKVGKGSVMKRWHFNNCRHK